MEHLGILWVPSLDWMVEFGLAVFVAFGLAWVWSRVVRVLWSLGVDRGARLAFSHAPVRFALVLWVWSGALSFSASPFTAAEAPGTYGWHSTTWTFDAFLPAFFTLLVTAWGIRNLRDMAGGLALSLTRPFDLGDEVATPHARGRVSSIGLTRVRIRSERGELVDVPAGEIATRTLRIAARGGGALPVSVEVHLNAFDAPDVSCDRLRDHALLSPYSDAGVSVVVELIDPHRARVVATPSHPDDADDLRSDIASRAAALASGGHARRVISQPTTPRDFEPGDLIPK